MKSVRPIRAVVLLAMLICGLNAAPSAGVVLDKKQESGGSLTLPVLWQRTLAADLPLDIEWKGEFEFHGVKIHRLLFTASVYKGVPQRVYALFATPAGSGPFPAILQIHGGGQTCYPAAVAWFVQRGYACLSFDWTGPEPGRAPEEVTHWATDIKDNWFGRTPGSVEDTNIFHATQAALQALDILAKQPAVDPQRIGIQGTSWGGLITWLVNALDSRPRAVVPVYGLGDLERHTSDLGDSFRKLTPQAREYWAANLDPARFIELQRAPMLYLDGSDDFFGPQDLAEQRLQLLKIPFRRVYCPNRMHSLNKGAVATGMAWLGAYLKNEEKVPAEPSLTLEADAEGNLVAMVQPDQSEAVASVEVDFARKMDVPLLRCWLTTTAQGDPQGLWRAKIPLVDPAQALAVTARVTYKSGFDLCSSVTSLVPSVKFPDRIHTTAAVRDIISAWGQPLNGWYVHRGSDFVVTEGAEPQLVSETLEGHPALVWKADHPQAQRMVSTRLTVDPACAPGGRRSLELWVHDLAQVTIRTNYSVHDARYKVFEVVKKAGPGWQRLLLEPAEFKPGTKAVSRAAIPTAGTTFPGWENVYQLDLTFDVVSQGRPAIGLLQWVVPATGR